MDYREHLIRPLSKLHVNHLAQQIFANPADFDIVYQLIYDADEKVSWRAASACQKISEKNPKWFTDKQFNELTTLSISTSHGGLLRGCLSILNNLSLPDPFPVELLNACFDWMVSPKSPISVQALSMKMLLLICKIEPELKSELIAYLEYIDSENYSAGFKSTRKNVLKALNNK